MNKTIPTAAALTGLALLTIPALALEPTLPRAPKVFARLDTDSDGKISRQELQPKAVARFDRVDSDKNGEVTAAEIDATLQKYLTLRRNRMLKDMDADANGGISKAELEQFVDRLVKAADGDADGGVTLEEARSFKLAKLRKTLNGGSAN